MVHVSDDAALAMQAGVRIERRRGPVARSMLWFGSWCIRHPAIVICGGFIVAEVLAAIFAPVIAPYDPFFADPRVRLQGSSATHWLGTDTTGRDVLSRLIYGARTSLGIASASVAISLMLGTLVGLITGYRGGTLDLVVQRLVDALQSFPPLVLAMLVIAMFGRGQEKAIIPIAVIFVPITARVVRGSVIGIKGNDFVTAAKVIGAGETRLLARHIFPNVVAPILVIGSHLVAVAILVEASLSFLGLGAQPPTPSWGGMLATDGRRYLAQHPYLVVYPSLAISLTVLAANLLGDAIRDALDPKLRGR